MFNFRFQFERLSLLRITWSVTVVEFKELINSVSLLLKVIDTKNGTHGLESLEMYIYTNIVRLAPLYTFYIYTYIDR